MQVHTCDRCGRRHEVSPVGSDTRVVTAGGRMRRLCHDLNVKAPSCYERETKEQQR